MTFPVNWINTLVHYKIIVNVKLLALHRRLVGGLIDSMELLTQIKLKISFVNTRQIYDLSIIIANL